MDGSEASVARQRKPDESNRIKERRENADQKLA
jgi:hypothetical protein